MASNVRGKENRIRMGTSGAAPRVAPNAEAAPTTAPRVQPPVPSCRLLSKMPYPVPAPRSESKFRQI